MSPTPTLTLYTYFRSSAATRVRTLLSLQGTPYESEYIHLLKGDQRSASYTSLNPSGAVPTLKVSENALEGLLKKYSGGKFAYGDSLTLADVALAPQMYTCLRFGANLADYPTCAAVFKHVSSLPEFIAADWKHQPDTPEELRA
ncbi:hypothetical protein CspHIS471_0108420 [Cutaneotrichosporon sp. HIS471]|nr:hypothetical protein CspHIS471_0108420 [Cutaneotrichosporon sp. HIS471]